MTPTAAVRRASVALGAVVAAALALPQAAHAHGVVGRLDLPLPAEVFGAAAAGVLVLSFVALAAGWSAPRFETYRERRLFRLPVIVDVLGGALGLGVFCLTVYAGLAGVDSPLDNLAPTMVYVIVWVGVPFASLLFGDVFRVLSPWRALARALGAVAGRVSRGGGAAEPLPYPERLGCWPAVAGVVAFGICELCWAAANEPTPLALLMLVYVAIQLVGMSLYGVEPWTRRADGLGVYFGLFARLAPLVRRDGALYARAPLVGATRLPEAAGVAALLVVAISVTAFDGAREGPLFNDLVPSVQDAFVEVGFGRPLALELAFVLGLGVTIAVIGAVYTLAVAAMPAPPGGDRAGLGRRFAHTLIPIVAAYVVAHYFSLLVYQGQDDAAPAVRPAGRRRRPARLRRPPDRLHGADRHGHLVRPGRRARRRPRRRARARPRPRAGDLRQPPRRRRLAGRDARADGLLHLPRPLPALGGQRLTHAVCRRGGRVPRWAVEMTVRQHQDELFVLWSAARAEANLAYDAWCGAPGAAAYAVYRAAEDRADAAEFALAAVAAAVRDRREPVAA